jgi:hypothetical protein
MTTTDGNLLLLPEGFSYGPSIVEVTTNASSPDGGGTGSIFGYGFGAPTQQGNAQGLQITVGGQPATITNYVGLITAPLPLPFPIEMVQYSVPSGSTDTAASITLTNSAGTITFPSAIEYLPTVKRYPLVGAALAQGIYDAKRDLYYFTDQNKIQAFSRTQGSWLPPMPIPNSNRLWGISLSSDGSKLAVADAGANLIYTLNPDSPSQIHTFTLPVNQGEAPGGLAITDSGTVYYVTFYLAITGATALHKLNTGSGAIVDYRQIQALSLADDAYSKVILSNDNARVYINIAGLVFAIDTATDTFFSNPVVAAGDYELALSSNQTWMSATEYLMDTNLNPFSTLAFTWREVFNVSAVYGEKLSPDGNLLFAPLLDGIDVLDGKMGTLRKRIALPFSLSPNFDALVVDGKDNILVAITGQNGDGVAVIDLTSLPEPLPLPFGLSKIRRLSAALQKEAPANAPRSPTTESSAKEAIPVDQILRRPKHVTSTLALRGRVH